MHPWEDFAETFATYFDMATILKTAQHFELPRVSANRLTEFDSMLSAYVELGLIVNELNRDMGLLDLVPEIFSPSVMNKLRFIHLLAQPSTHSKSSTSRNAT